MHSTVVKIAFKKLFVAVLDWILDLLWNQSKTNCKAALRPRCTLNFNQFPPLLICFAVTTHSNIITYAAAVFPTLQLRRNATRRPVHDESAAPEDIKYKLEWKATVKGDPSVDVYLEPEKHSHSTLDSFTTNNRKQSFILHACQASPARVTCRKFVLMLLGWLWSHARPVTLQ